MEFPPPPQRPPAAGKARQVPPFVRRRLPIPRVACRAPSKTLSGCSMFPPSLTTAYALRPGFPVSCKLPFRLLYLFFLRVFFRSPSHASFIHQRPHTPPPVNIACFAVIFS